MLNIKAKILNCSKKLKLKKHIQTPNHLLIYLYYTS